MKHSQSTVKPPTRKQLFTLRLMIVIGLICMFFFMNTLFRDNVVGYKPLYWLLISTFVYTFFKIVYEWYHYWSISIPETPATTRTYTVDILTTFCAGEPYEMIIETLRAMQAITYPHQSYLCDEADDPYLKSMCKELGVHHMTRKEKINAKAGNINHALRQTTGELCVILDPDHIPVPGFLDPIVSHFDRPEIGYVQIVQAYYNQDIGWIAKGAAQQTYQFYGPMMMCMNSYGTVQAIGANCTFRRAALDSIGGHAAGLAEDMHTAMQLHARGWKSIYVPQVLTKGLVPATLSAYYKQQLKWSRGVFELLITSYISLFTKFSWRQKLHYGLLPFFYLSGFIFLINFLIPVISLLTGTFPLKMDFSEFLIIGTPFIAAVVVIRHFVQQWVMEDDERGFHVVGGLLLIGTWWVFILGVVYTFIRKNVPYIATPKEVIDEKNLKYNLPNISVLLISVAAIAYGLYSDWNPFSLFMAGISGLNCLFMIFILIASSELKMDVYVKQQAGMYAVAKNIKLIKKQFWLLRRKVYTGVRRLSLLLIILVVCVSVYVAKHTGNDEASSVSFRSYSSRAVGSDNKPGKPENHPQVLSLSYFNAVRGVIYSKGSYWYKNIYPLTKKIITQDFKEIRQAGFNSIKIYGPNIYDHSILDQAAQNGLEVYYSFWIPDPSHFINNEDHLTQLSEQILKTVNNYKSIPSIKSWNLGNITFQQLGQYYQKKQVNQARSSYLKWLKDLVHEIKLADQSRTVTIDILASADLTETMNLIHREIPELNAFGLVIKNKGALKNISASLKMPYFISSADPKVFGDASFPPASIFYANWQDQQSASTVTFDGLKDIWGGNKSSLSRISAGWNGKISPYKLPPVKILRPALTTTTGALLSYRALVYLNDQWNLAGPGTADLQFEWYLVKTDAWGDAVAVNAIGNGPAVQVTIPPRQERYRIYLVARKGENSADDYTTLNTPLNN
ncbi:glycosyltransferase family 2 protein [Pedobacter nutrimenti]|uniref:glycosyltransferase family 2 protein n=1 Tax=Pedobacter nutrimenti TaxID=1241337 RepID=UPI00292D4D82|nr:glycosyltransferase family 2 protein [Pedobacter nutrimenti]